MLVFFNNDDTIRQKLFLSQLIVHIVKFQFSVSGPISLIFDIEFSCLDPILVKIKLSFKFPIIHLIFTALFGHTTHQSQQTK